MSIEKALSDLRSAHAASTAEGAGAIWNGVEDPHTVIQLMREAQHAANSDGVLPLSVDTRGSFSEGY